MDEDITIGCLPLIVLGVVLALLLAVVMWHALDAINSPSYTPSTTTHTAN